MVSEGRFSSKRQIVSFELNESYIFHVIHESQFQTANSNKNEQKYKHFNNCDNFKLLNLA